MIRPLVRSRSAMRITVEPCALGGFANEPFSKSGNAHLDDAKFAALSVGGKLTFLFLLTHPNQTMLGAMRATVPGLASELRMEPPVFTRAFEEHLTSALARYGEYACLVWLPNLLKYNIPESPNVARAWPKALDLLPECQLKASLQEQATVYAESLPQAFREAFHEVFGTRSESISTAFPQSLPNQEQEHEQQQQQEQTNTLALTTNTILAGGSSIFIMLPLNDKSTYPIVEKRVTRREELYPNVNVRQELRKYAGWADAHPTKRKTCRGILGSVNS